MWMAKLFDGDSEEVSCNVRDNHVSALGSHFWMPVQLLFLRGLLRYRNLGKLGLPMATKMVVPLASSVTSVWNREVKDVLVVLR